MTSDQLFQKLRLDPAKKILILNIPDDLKEIFSELDYLDYDEDIISNISGTYDFILIFATKKESLIKVLEKVVKTVKYDGVFWVSYPKKSSSIESELVRDHFWDIFSHIGFRPVSQIALDNNWSALRGRPKELVGRK